MLGMCLETKSLNITQNPQRSSERGTELFPKGKGSFCDPEHRRLSTAETPRVL